MLGYDQISDKTSTNRFVPSPLKYLLISFVLYLSSAFILSGCEEGNDPDSVYGQWVSDGFVPVSIRDLSRLELDIKESNEVILTATFNTNKEEITEKQVGKLEDSMLYIKSGSAQLIRDGELLKMIDPTTRETTVFRRQ